MFMSQSDLLAKISSDNESFREVLRELNEKQGEPEGALRIVVCGLLKAGKSSLLNALTGNLEKDYFATNAARATAFLAEYPVDDVIYVDTPGIDATEEDDEEAWRGLASADQVLFAHGLRCGELHQQEIDFLKALKARIPDVVDRLVIVLTRLDECEGAFPVLQAKIAEQIELTLGKCPPLLGTSVTRFRKGVLENKGVLTARSGFPALQDHMARLKDSLAARLLFDRTERDNEVRRKLAGLFDLEISRREQKSFELARDKQQQLGRLLADLHGFQDGLAARVEKYNQT